jgi:hypothetical protein
MMKPRKVQLAGKMREIPDEEKKKIVGGGGAETWLSPGIATAAAAISNNASEKAPALINWFGGGRNSFNGG